MSILFDTVTKRVKKRHFFLNNVKKIIQMKEHRIHIFAYTPQLNVQL